MRAHRGFSVLEVLIALVLLGVISVIYMQTTRYSQKNAGKAIDWQVEGVVVEKTIEHLRTGRTLRQLQSIDSSWTDSSGKLKVEVHAKGGQPPASICKGFPPERLARLRVVARREHFDDSIAVTTDLWVD